MIFFNANLLEVTMSGIGNIPQNIYESRWTPENRENAKWPKAYAGYGRTMKLSDRYVEDGSYLRMKNINLGYKFISPFKGIESINLFASVSNVFTISGYSWYDPDVNSFGSDASRRGGRLILISKQSHLLIWFTMYILMFNSNQEKS